MIRQNRADLERPDFFLVTHAVLVRFERDFCIAFVTDQYLPREKGFDLPHCSIDLIEIYAKAFVTVCQLICIAEDPEFVP